MKVLRTIRFGIVMNPESEQEFHGISLVGPSPVGIATNDRVPV